MKSYTPYYCTTEESVAGKWKGTPQALKFIQTLSKLITSRKTIFKGFGVEDNSNIDDFINIDGFVRQCGLEGSDLKRASNDFRVILGTINKEYTDKSTEINTNTIDPSASKIYRNKELMCKALSDLNELMDKGEVILTTCGEEPSEEKAVKPITPKKVFREEKEKTTKAKPKRTQQKELLTIGLEDPDKIEEKLQRSRAILDYYFEMENKRKRRRMK